MLSPEELRQKLDVEFADVTPPPDTSAVMQSGATPPPAMPEPPPASSQPRMLGNLNLDALEKEIPSPEPPQPLQAPEGDLPFRVARGAVTGFIKGATLGGPDTAFGGLIDAPSPPGTPRFVEGAGELAGSLLPYAAAEQAVGKFIEGGGMIKRGLRDAVVFGGVDAARPGTLDERMKRAEQGAAVGAATGGLLGFFHTVGEVAPEVTGKVADDIFSQVRAHMDSLPAELDKDARRAAVMQYATEALKPHAENVGDEAIQGLGARLADTVIENPQAPVDFLSNMSEAILAEQKAGVQALIKAKIAKDVAAEAELEPPPNIKPVPLDDAGINLGAGAEHHPSTSDDLASSVESAARAAGAPPEGVVIARKGRVATVQDTVGDTHLVPIPAKIVDQMEDTLVGRQVHFTDEGGVIVGEQTYARGAPDIAARGDVADLQKAAEGLFEPAAKASEVLPEPPIAPSKGLEANAMEDAADLYRKTQPEITPGEINYNLTTGQIPYGLSKEEEAVVQKGIDAAKVHPDYNQAVDEVARVAGAPVSPAAETVQNLRPAIRYKGEVFTGKKGQVHGDVLSKMPEVKDLEGKAFQDAYNKMDIGFVDESGNYLTRQQAYAQIAVKPKLRRLEPQDELHASHLDKTGNVKVPAGVEAVIPPPPPKVKKPPKYSEDLKAQTAKRIAEATGISEVEARQHVEIAAAKEEIAPKPQMPPKRADVSAPEPTLKAPKAIKAAKKLPDIRGRNKDVKAVALTAGDTQAEPAMRDALTDRETLEAPNSTLVTDEPKSVLTAVESPRQEVPEPEYPPEGGDDLDAVLGGLPKVGLLKTEPRITNEGIEAFNFSKLPPARKGHVRLFTVHNTDEMEHKLLAQKLIVFTNSQDVVEAYGRQKPGADLYFMDLPMTGKKGAVTLDKFRMSNLQPDKLMQVELEHGKMVDPTREFYVANAAIQRYWPHIRTARLGRGVMAEVNMPKAGELITEKAAEDIEKKVIQPRHDKDLAAIRNEGLLRTLVKANERDPLDPLARQAALDKEYVMKFANPKQQAFVEQMVKEKVLLKVKKDTYRLNKDLFEEDGSVKKTPDLEREKPPDTGNCDC